MTNAKPASLTRDLLRQIDSELAIALKPIAEKFGVEIKLGNGSFNDAECTKKIKIRVELADAIKGKESNQFSELLGLPKDVVGKTFVMGGKTYEVIRLDVQKPKFPVIISLVGNPAKKYKISTEQFNRYNLIVTI